MKSKDVILLICSERSGSNLIRAMADAHPMITAPAPVHFFRDIASKFDVAAMGGADTRAKKLLLKTLARSLKRHLPEEVAQQAITRAKGINPFAPRELARGIFSSLLESSGKSKILIKENNFANLGAPILDCFPKAKFVFQVRDPRDYLASALALREQRFGNKFGSFRNAMTLWEEDQQFGLRMLGHFGPQRVFFQRYEDLIAQPDKVLRSMCDFLEVPFDIRMLAFHEEEAAKTLSQKAAAWQNLSRPVMSDNANKYRQVLNRRQIAGVEASVGDLMDRFGYNRDISLKESQKRWHMIWPSLTEPLERSANKEWSPFYELGRKEQSDRFGAVTDTVSPAYALPAPESPSGNHGPQPLIEQLWNAARSNRKRSALRVGGKSLTYDELFGSANALASEIRAKFGDRPRVAVFAARHASSYHAILAIILAGGSYIPLNCRNPAQRNREVIERSGAELVLHGDRFSKDVADITKGLAVITLISDVAAAPSSDFEDALPDASCMDAGDPAYVLFTSGSTGEPKGVEITHGNLTSYLSASRSVLQPLPDDRFSQTFDLTFDLSVHDLFLCWTSGAELVVASLRDLSTPADYIRKEGITLWFSVPSLAYSIRQQGRLVPGAFASIRFSLFCGEALPSDLGHDWQAAAPNGPTENWYGPTEATIACTRYRLPQNFDPRETLVPIGTAMEGTRVQVVGDDGSPIADGSVGRLLIGGPQVASGYYNAPELTAQHFQNLPGQDGTFYNTGDLVRSIDGILHFVGRSDHQVKIRGYRVELGEVEARLRQKTSGANVVALAWPSADPNPTHIVAVVETDDEEKLPALEELHESLASYMVPSRLFAIGSFPKTTSGKIDRKTIAAQLAERIAATAFHAPDEAEDLESKVASAVISVKPSIDPKQLREARSLLWAGLDSMDFVKLTMIFERDFGKKLDEDFVADMAVMSFPDLCNSLRNPAARKSNFEGLRPSQIGRVNRAQEFVRKFGSAIVEEPGTLCLAVGTSGTLRGFGPSAAEAEARAAGRSITAFNAGLPALNCEGIARICRFVRETCETHSVKFDAVFYELDPMMISAHPPPGDVSLDESFFGEAAQTPSPARLSSEFRWARETRGDVEFDEEKIKSARKPLWERERDKTIATVYSGAEEFDLDQLSHWLSGAQELSSVSRRVLGWIHPLQSRTKDCSNLEQLIEHVQTKFGLTIMGPGEFSMQREWFLNINHVEPFEGKPALTRQLVRRLLAPD